MNGAIPEKFLSASFVKGNFNDPAGAFRIRYRKVGQPVVYVHTITTAR